MPKYPDYKEHDRISTFLTLGANAVGAILSTIYFSVVFPVPVDQAARSVSAEDVFLNVVVIVVLLAGGIILSSRSENFQKKYHDLLREGYPADQLPGAAKRHILNFPASAALVSISMWLLAGIFSGFASGMLNVGIGIFMVGGILTTSTVYFAQEYRTRLVLPLYFPDGKIHQIKASRLNVFGRLVIFFVLVGLYPVGMLSIVALDRARFMLESPDPHLVLENMILGILFVVAVSVVAGISMTYLVTYSIVGPLGMLQEGMAKVESNDLTVQLPVVSNDEIGYVSESFNNMVGGLRKAEVLRNLLNIYVSPEVAREALERGTQLGGQLVECSVLFSDIRGFTTLSEQLPPQELIGLLNRYMTVMVEVIVANGGMVNKFGGDSLLAVFGTPLNYVPNHAASALRAAMDMESALDRFNMAQREQNAPQLRIGIGIASGPVVAGNIGGHERIEYTVIGDTVNLAARLQSMTKGLGYTLLTSDATYTAAQGLVHLTAKELPELAVRGKHDPVKVYAILSS